jgi:uncharacterized peroxidase-related enzyme
VRAATQASFEALFHPARYGGLTPVDRELAALRVAVLQQQLALASLHRQRARALGATAVQLQAIERPAQGTHNAGPWAWLLRFVDRLTLVPATAEASHLQDLQRHGLAPRDIVTLAQLVAFVNYQVRVLAGLRALADATGLPTTTSESTPALAIDEHALQRGQHGPVQHAPATLGFTIQPLDWAAWLPTVDLAQADADQLAVLDESHASARSSPYYLTLVHEPAVLRQRSRLFNAIMYGPGGLPRAERELTTLGVSLVNGCPYCASVHARLFAQLSKEPQVPQALFDEGVNAALSPRRRALVDLAVVLSANPPALSAGHVELLRRHRLDDAQILDAIHAAAIFAWANRLMQTLGEPVVPRPA